jgi:hypothetical protein
VNNEGLQKALMQSVLAVPAPRSHFERSLSELANKSPIESLILYLEHIENQLHWIDFQSEERECGICFEMTKPAKFCTSTCGHSVCSDCAPTIAACPLCRHAPPRWAGGGYFAEVPSMVGAGNLENLESLGIRVIERLRGIALARYVAWDEAQTLIGLVDDACSVP